MKTVKSMEDLNLDTWYNLGLIITIKVKLFTKINVKLNILKEVEKEIKEIEEIANCKLFINKYDLENKIKLHLSKTK